MVEIAEMDLLPLQIVTVPDPISQFLNLAVLFVLPHTLSHPRYSAPSVLLSHLHLLL